MTTSIPSPTATRSSFGPSAATEPDRAAGLRVASSRSPRVVEPDDLNESGSCAAVVLAVSWSQAPSNVETTLAVALTASEPDS